MCLSVFRVHLCVQGLYSRTPVAMLASLHKVCCYMYNVHVCIQLCSFSLQACVLDLNVCGFCALIGIIHSREKSNHV